MTTADNILILHDAGHTRQARIAARAESVSVLCDSTDTECAYLFRDGSAFMLVSGTWTATDRAAFDAAA